MPTLDQDFLRASFPALGRGQVFLDNAGGSQIARHVVERMSEFLYGSNVQLGATYGASALAGERVAEGRAALALMVNAARPEEVVMGATATQLFDQLARALVQTWSPGDEVVVTEFDHEANISPWRRLAEQGIEVRTWRLRPGELQPRLEDLEALLTPRTRLVAVTHVSNIFGTINPVRAIADLAHANGAQVCVDGVAYAPHRAVDVQALDADFYGFSVYKTFGAHFAALYGRHDALLAAGGVNHAFIPQTSVPQKLEPGNASHEVAYSCAGVVAYLEDLARAHGVNADGLEQKMIMNAGYQGVWAYLLRPNPKYRQIINNHTSQVLSSTSSSSENNSPTSSSSSFDNSVGFPIRGSDKCVRESTCLSMQTYMELALDVYHDRLDNGNMNKKKNSNLTSEFSARQSLSNLIVTTEDAKIFNEVVRFSREYQYHDSSIQMTGVPKITNDTSFPYIFLLNANDNLQGSGNPKFFRKDGHSTMVSSLVATNLQLYASEVYGNCCSNWHTVIRRLVEAGLSSNHNATFTCLNHAPAVFKKRKYRICCHFKKDKECKQIFQEYQNQTTAS